MPGSVLIRARVQVVPGGAFFIRPSRKRATLSAPRTTFRAAFALPPPSLAIAMSSANRVSRPSRSARSQAAMN